MARSANLPVAFGAILGGGLLLRQGIEHVETALKGGGTGTAPSSGQPITGSGMAAVKAAAAKWHIPAGILWGVFGAETNYGRQVDTSSAGAQGPFQFLPSTAADYGGDAALGKQGVGPAADAAAHLLSDLKRQYGSWDLALEHYSGGAYGISHVDSLAQGLPTG